VSGDALRSIGDALRRAGLTQNALLAWAGTHRLSALPRIVPALARRPITPASAVLALFVAGADVPLARLRGLPIDALVAHGIIDVAAGPGDRSPIARDLIAGEAIEPTSTRELTAGEVVEPASTRDRAAGEAVEPASTRDRAAGEAVEPATPSELFAPTWAPLALEHARARIAILPLEQTLLVCDRFDAPSSRELVLCPDDSSYHLASAIPPGRRERWIDLATGSAFAPLARPALASQIVGIDLNPRAVALTRIGAGLSGCAHVDARCGDIGGAMRAAHDGATRATHDDATRATHDDATRATHDDATRATHDEAPAPTGLAQLVTCNAPILGDPDRAMWRSTDRAFFHRMWRAARACVAVGGEVIVHCVLDGVPGPQGELDADLALDGDVTIVVYTPPGERPYCVVWWSPHAPAHHVLAYRELTRARPHLDPRDRDDARG
jgi:hypothetical protein